MGTWATLVIFYQHQICLAVTGRYDGMPSQEGREILRFISNEANIFKLRAALSRPVIRSARESEIESAILHRRDSRRAAANDNNALSSHPSIMPDHVSEVLKLAISAEGIGALPVEDDIQHVLDTSEFVYVLELDKNLFEVYCGLTTTDQVLDDRFEDVQRSAKLQWTTPALVRRWSLSSLPSEGDFVDLTDVQDDSEGSDW